MIHYPFPTSETIQVFYLYIYIMNNYNKQLLKYDNNIKPLADSHDRGYIGKS